MPSKNERVLLVDEQLGLSKSAPGKGQDALMYLEDLARGGSSVSKGSKVILLSEKIAQGPAALIDLGKLKGDTALYVGDTLDLKIAATNTAGGDIPYTVNWKEDGNEFKEETNTIGGGGTVVYRASRTKDSTGKWTYQANDSNELTVAWMQIDPGPLEAFPRTVWTGETEPSTKLSIQVAVPSSESNAQDVTIEFQEEGSQIASASQTIDPGKSYTFTTTRSHTDPGIRDFTATITNNNTGISVDTNTISVKWTDNKAGAIALEELKADDRLLYKGDTVNLSIDALNTADTSITYTLEFYEGPTLFSDETNTLSSREVVTYSASRSKSVAGTFTYQAKDPDGINTSNELNVTWLNVRPGKLTASRNKVYLSDSNHDSTLSIPVENPGSDGIGVTVKIYRSGTEIYSDSRSIGAGSSETFSVTENFDEPEDFEYQAEVIETESGIGGRSNITTVRWMEEKNEFAFVPLTMACQSTAGGDQPLMVAEPGGSDDQGRLNDTAEVVSIAHEDTFISEATTGDEPDFDDCYADLNPDTWEDFGYTRIETYHGESTESHNWWIGGTDGYDAGHTFTVYAYQDGEVTDGDGNVLGSWK